MTQVLHKPPGLSDEMQLPFSVWRILDVIDGEKTVSQIAHELEMSNERVFQELDHARQWIRRLQQHNRKIDDQIIEEIKQVLIGVIGPVGEFLVEDARDLVREDAAVIEFLSTLIRVIKEDAEAAASVNNSKEASVQPNSNTRLTIEQRHELSNQRIAQFVQNLRARGLA